jgi:phospholipid/cholesterol/gamma-HCH transport system permease protein
MLDSLQALGRATLHFFERLGRGHLFLLQTLAKLPGLLLRPAVCRHGAGFAGL